MSDKAAEGAAVVGYLREQFARVHARFDRLEEKVSNLQVRVTQIDREIGSLRLGVADLNGRLDSMERRLDRIDEKLSNPEACNRRHNARTGAGQSSRRPDHPDPLRDD
jgi:tetrahydromethanopterin S-methyltransferase subunit G